MGAANVPTADRVTSFDLADVRQPLGVFREGEVIAGAAAEQLRAVAISGRDQGERHAVVGDSLPRLLERSEGAAALAIGLEVKRLEGEDNAVHSDNGPQVLLRRS